MQLDAHYQRKTATIVRFRTTWETSPDTKKNTSGETLTNVESWMQRQYVCNTFSVWKAVQIRTELIAIR